MWNKEGDGERVCERARACVSFCGAHQPFNREERRPDETPPHVFAGGEETLKHKLGISRSADTCRRRPALPVTAVSWRRIMAPSGA